MWARNQSLLFPVDATECGECGLLTFKEAINDNGHCSACHTNLHTHCEECEVAVRWDNIKDDGLCSVCWDKYYFICEDCNNEYDRDKIAYTDDDGHNYCPRCDEHYYYCEDCGHRMHSSSDEIRSTEDFIYCESCFEEKRDDDFEDHCPRIQYHGKGPRYYGVELEFECEEGTRKDAFDETLEFFYNDASIKHDGSLSHGFEIATQPGDMTTIKEWLGAYLESLPNGVYADDTCGMHVHVSRKTISALTLGKLLVFLNAEENRPMIQKIAGRKQFYNGHYEPKRITDGTKPSGKYEALNVGHRNTIEFRIFAGTTDKEELLGRLEFVEWIIPFCAQASLNGLDAATFQTWIKNRRCPHLKKLLD